MIDNLTEAIAHAKEVAEKKREEVKYWKKVKGVGVFTDENTEHLLKTCEDCANEHEQLAEWLTELKELRETMEMMKKHYILVEKSPRDNPNDFMVGGVVPDNLQGWRYEEKENDK